MDTPSDAPPDFQKGDYVGFHDSVTWEKDGGKVKDNAWVVTAPYKVGDHWKVTINFNKNRLDPLYASIYTSKDINIRAENIYLIERSTKGKLKEISKVKLSKPAIITGVILVTIAIFIMSIAANYNDLVKGRNAVSNARAQIDTRLEERYEVIDNIVASVEGSQAQESDVFKAIAEARKVGGSATSAGEEASANAQIDQQIALLPRLQESYPELRSNDQISKLIADVQGKALGIRESRDNYNTVVTNYNNNISSFPKNIYAGLFGFESAELFKGSAEAKVNPKVEINREK